MKTTRITRRGTEGVVMSVSLSRIVVEQKRHTLKGKLEFTTDEKARLLLKKLNVMVTTI